MNNVKKIAGCMDVPEICRDYPLDWGKYDPPGGSDWIAYFFNTVQPTFKETLAAAEKDLTKVKESEARRNAIRKGIEAAAAIAKMVVEYDAAFPNELDGAMHAPLAEWTAATAALAASDPFNRSENGRTAEMIEDDIKFLKAIENYFNADIELDAVLYAMYKVEPKFKAKLFRHVMRLLPVVETNRAYMNASKSKIKSLTWNVYEPAVKLLDESYATLSPMLRKMKKKAAQNIPGFWETVV